MRILICLDGTNTERVLTATLDAVQMAGAEIQLLHVLDVGPKEHAELLRDRYVGRGGMGSHWRMRLDIAAQARGQDIVDLAEARFAALLAARTNSGDAPHMERALIAGPPEREIVRTAGTWPADLVVLAARRQGSPPPPPGPKFLGHVARFVTDHAPCPVLLLRP
jgi:nucleotide-binding universal stress UspA family protein